MYIEEFTKQKVPEFMKPDEKSDTTKTDKAEKNLLKKLPKWDENIHKNSLYYL